MRIAEFFYPRRCVLCDRVMMQQVFTRMGYLCPACETKPIYIREPVCKKCGRMLRDETAEYCAQCRRGHHVFDEGRSLLLYTDDVKRMMYRYKYGNTRWYREFFLMLLKARLAEWITQSRFDLVVPVPLHRKRYRKRGYNQAALIARDISAAFGIPLEENFIERSAETKPLKALGYEERKNNLKNAFTIGKNVVLLECMKILLVDDIYTTGATVDEIASLIKSRCGCRVSFFSICTSRADS